MGNPNVIHVIAMGEGRSSVANCNSVGDDCIVRPTLKYGGYKGIWETFTYSGGQMKILQTEDSIFFMSMRSLASTADN